MKRISSALAACIASLAAFAAQAADLTAAQIVDRNVAARGGLDAWRAISSISMSGDMDAGGKTDAKLPFVMSLKRPHKSRLEIRFQDKTALQVFDGVQGWKYRPFLNREDVDPFSAAEASSAAATAELDGPLVDYVKKGTQVALEGTEAVEGKNAYKLKVTPKAGPSFNLWIDSVSFLEVKIDGEPRRLDKKVHPVAVFYRDYKTVGAVKVPYTMETVVEGVKATRKMTFKTVTINPPLADTLFAKPQPGPEKGPAAQ
jgi:outer membrane lipoprotein-sorting protein